MSGKLTQRIWHAGETRLKLSSGFWTEISLLRKLLLKLKPIKRTPDINL
jgi:hypothetical protein